MSEHPAEIAARIDALAESISGDEGVEHNPGCEGEPDCLACIVEDLYVIRDAARPRVIPPDSTD